MELTTETVIVPLGGKRVADAFSIVDSVSWEREFCIELRSGGSIQIKPCDLNWIARPHRRTIYAHSSIKRNRITTGISLHRLITLAPRGVQVDHRDGDGLNNQLSNLRFATSQQNQCNQRKQLGTSSRFKGVVWHKGGNKWMAQTKVFGRRMYLGLHETEEDAARAYDRAALEYFGEFARLNFPQEQLAASS